MKIIINFYLINFFKDIKLNSIKKLNDIGEITRLLCQILIYQINQKI